MSLYLKYFVLKPDGAGPHSKASRVAMMAYAESIDKEDPELADSLRSWTEETKQEGE